MSEIQFKAGHRYLVKNDRWYFSPIHEIEILECSTNHIKYKDKISGIIDWCGKDRFNIIEELKTLKEN